MKRLLVALCIILIASNTLLVGCTADVQRKGTTPEVNNTAPLADFLGKWRHYVDAGVSGQSMGEIEFRDDGTFSFVMAIVVSTGSGFTSTTYGVAASSEGKYKVTGENKVLLYAIRGGRHQENKYLDNLYEIIEKTYTTRDITTDDSEYIYTLEHSLGEDTLTLEPIVEKESDILGFALFKADYILTLTK